MAKRKRSRAKRLILDLGSSAVRLCELTQTKSGYQLTRYYQKEYPIDPSMDESAKKEVRTDTLRELLRDAKIRTKKAVFAVPGQSVFTRTRALPPVPEYKVTQIVRYEIQQQIPFSLDQIALDYQVLSRTEAGGYDVLMAAIKVDVVDKYVDIVMGAKRQVDTVDVAPLAAYNWLKHTGEFGDQGECVALVDFGATTTDIVIERDNQFRFTRSVNVGGNDVTSALARAFNVSFAEAERMKRDRGFAPTGDPQRDGKGGEVIGQVLSRLVAEISRSFAYFRSQPGGAPVSRLILCGGGACLRNIVPYLQRSMGVEVRIAQPLAGLTVAPAAQEINEHPEQAAVALGLALRPFQDVAIAIDLIPPRIIDAARRREQTLYWAFSLATLLLILASIIPVTRQKHQDVKDNIDTLKMQLTQYDAKLASAATMGGALTSDFETQLKAEKAKVNENQVKVDFLDIWYRSRQQWLLFLNAINDARPSGKGLWISAVESTVIADMSGSSAGGMRGYSAMASASPTAPGASQDIAPAFSSSGFPGILAPRVGAMMGAPAMPGGAPAPVAPTPASKEQTVPRPNGLVVHGYATDPEVVLEFVANLKAGGQFVEGGVYFDDRLLKTVPYQEINTATVSSTLGPGRASLSAGSDGSRRRDEDSENEDLELEAMGGGLSGPSTSFGMRSLGIVQDKPLDMTWMYGPRLTAFRLDLQFYGEAVKPQEGAA